MKRIAWVFVLSLLGATTAVAQNADAKPPLIDWCRQMPRPEYKQLERVTITGPLVRSLQTRAGSLRDL